MSGESMHSPRVSVIVPTYNYARFLPRALDSVLAQTWRDYEIIVVDDGSTDDTPEVAKAYGERIHYLRKENGGAATARNTGILAARGELLAFLDADDAWVPEKLARQVEYLDRHPEFGMVYSDMAHHVAGRKVHDAYLRERGYSKVAEGWIFDNLLRQCFIFTPTVMARRKCFDTVGLHDPELRTCQDVDMWLRIADRFMIGFIDAPLAVRHEHGDNSTRNWDNYLGNPIKMFLKLNASQADPARRAIFRERLRDMYFDLGWHQFRTGRMKQCRASMRESLRYGRPVCEAGKYIVLSFVPPWAINRLRMIAGRRPAKES